MSRVFAYCRVSTLDQTVENQSREIAGAGFQIEPHRIIGESVSGSVAANERPGFMKLLDRMEPGDILVVTKLDRLGRNAMDVRFVVERLEALGVRVHCMALGGVDLTSPAGKFTMQVIAAVAEFECDLMRERTMAGIARARAAGVAFGRKPALGPRQRSKVLTLLAGPDVNISKIARDFGTTQQTIRRIRKAAGLKKRDMQFSQGGPILEP